MILEHRLSTKKPAPTPTDIGSSSTTHPNETEKPPPYTPGQGYNPSHQRSAAPLPPIPERPNLRIPSASSSKFPDPGPSQSENTAESPTVTQIHLQAKDEQIIGTFYVDPRTPSTTKDKKKRGKGQGPALPHASFKSRSGAIQLALGTTGETKHAESQKANVTVTSGSGAIDIQLLPMRPMRPRIGLDVSSQQGDITVHFPETFSGVIQLVSRKGKLTVLPVLLNSVKVLKATEKEAILVMGAMPSATHMQDGSYLMDLCQITSRSGKVVIGMSGRDKEPEKAGFWKKLGQILRGSE
ncbi:hypothetical protein FA15DRAFT_663819 [Coprinopsis marcescibilis]|uniref:DUF7330 domain-containing protein n=1 Tax=Coprinopsis marcescibilis TaxID=230819 RepID=A0A5C3LAM7_COPMA|nr:hypothetical protein FA15DRAFT_663819 [Coprinopsis marcescibilis]